MDLNTKLRENLVWDYLHLHFQEEDEDDEDMDGSEDGTASPTASEDEQHEGNVYKWRKYVGLVDILHKQDF